MDKRRPWFPPPFAFRFLTVVTVSCISAGLAFAAETHPRGLSPDEHIDQRCTFCHSRILAVVLLVRRLDTQGAAATDAFLVRHHMPDAEARGVIMRYLGEAAK